MLILSGCATKNEPNENEQNKVVEPATKSDGDKLEDTEQIPEKDKEKSSEDNIDDKTGIDESFDSTPAEPEATTPSKTPESDSSVDEEVKEDAETELETLSAEIQKTEIFSMSMLLDTQQIADLYGNISAEQFDSAIVMKNMISPGGDETAIFKVKEVKWML